MGVKGCFWVGADPGTGAGQVRGARRDGDSVLPRGLGGREAQGAAWSPAHISPSVPPSTVLGWTPSRAELLQRRTSAAGWADELLQKPLELVGAAVGWEVVPCPGRW